MAEFRHIHPPESDRYFLKRGQMDLTEYEKFLSGLKSGTVGVAAIQDSETERAVKRRLTVAAKNQGKQLQYSKRADKGTVVFRVK
jgi:hypothetical protein